MASNNSNTEIEKSLGLGDAASEEGGSHDLGAPVDGAEAGQRFQKALAARRDSQRPAAVRERPKNFGGPRLKMAVIGEIPGFHLYWENDDGEGAIEQLLYEGFEFVEPSEVSMVSHIVSDTDTASRVSRFVGSKKDGTPMRAYLLKCPDELWSERQSYRLAQADDWDNSIRNAQVEPDAGRYLPKGAAISLDTQFRKEH
jgi:hypothetical protein